MSPPLIRKSFVVPTDDDVALDVAAKNGFPTAKPALVGEGLRRKLPPNRHFQFNVRLRKDTVEFIYGQADARGVVVAKVLEDMVEVYVRFLADKL